ncbi:hypothetical protein ACHWQZ_G004876 [Mnemiopsis leidyi]
MEAYGMNNVLIISWFLAVFLTNLIVFAVLIHKVQFRKKSRCLVLLSSLYYIIYSLTITIFSFTVKIERFRDAFCAHIMGSLCLAIIVGNVFCVLGVTVERFIYIVYALQYKRIINSTRMIMFTLVLFVLSLSYMLAAMTGGLKFHTVKYQNNTVICTVNDKSSPTQMVSYITLFIYLIAFSMVPILWLRIHFLRNNIKRLCLIQNKSRCKRSQEVVKQETLFQPVRKGTASPRSGLAVRVGSRIKTVYCKSPDIVRCEATPVAVQRLRNKPPKQTSFLSTTKSSRHTIKIFLVSFVLLKIQYVCLFPPFIQKIGETDNLPLVMLISFADALFGCLLLVAADVELKQIFFKFIRMCCIKDR